jgi:predicted NBD/HSP70 family sugar kinase
MSSSVKMPPPWTRTNPGRALVRVFDVLCGEGPVTRVGLGQALGASPSTITTAVHQLQSLGLVAETGTAESTGGRPATIIGLARSVGCVLAVDIGAINVRVAVADVAGRVVERRSFATTAATTSRRFKGALVDTLDALAGTAGGPVLAVTLAVPAVVDPTSRRVSLSTVPAWPSGDPGRWLDHLDAPVLVENEANMAAFGESVRGSARGAASALFVALGAGVGAGIVVGGRLYRGATGAAGEIGYTVRTGPDASTRLEESAAAAAIVRRYRELSGGSDAATAEAVFDRARNGDVIARDVLRAAIDQLATGIANAIVLIDPEVVVVGGGMSAAGPALLDPLVAGIRDLVPIMPKVVPSALGPEAALVGATLWGARDAQARLRASLEAVATD